MTRWALVVLLLSLLLKFRQVRLTSGIVLACLRTLVILVYRLVARPVLAGPR